MTVTQLLKLGIGVNFGVKEKVITGTIKSNEVMVSLRFEKHGKAWEEIRMVNWHTWEDPNFDNNHVLECVFKGLCLKCPLLKVGDINI